MILKWIFDRVVSLLGLLFLWPVLLVVAILIKVKMPGGPVLFVQKRVGLGGKLFNCHKFRTMTDGRDKQGNLLPDEQRTTKFGKWLRSTSLDELPELINIIKPSVAIPIHYGSVVGKPSDAEHFAELVKEPVKVVTKIQYFD